MPAFLSASESFAESHRANAILMPVKINIVTAITIAILIIHLVNLTITLSFKPTDPSTSQSLIGHSVLSDPSAALDSWKISSASKSDV